jgi:hypothetical protein
MDREVFVYVDLDGVPHLMGQLWARVRKDKESATFEYAPAWLGHPSRFSLEPALALGPGPFHTAGDTPMFGAIGEWIAITGGGSTEQPQSPNQDFYPLNETWDLAFKALGSYDLPWDLRVAAVYHYLVGAPNYHTVMAPSAPSRRRASIGLVSAGNSDSSSECHTPWRES